MNYQVDRRYFLKTAGTIGAGIGLLGLGNSRLLAAPSANGAPNAEKLGWHLGCQAYTFRKFTFYEAIDQIASVGLHYVETYPGQKLSRQKPNILTNASVSPAIRKEIKKKLADSGVKLINHYLNGLTKKEADTRRLFDYAKDMGVETIVSEPTPDAFDTIEKLCNEYGINLAVHNHPAPSRYWNPETVLQVCKGRGKRIGACPDTGHWVRSGIKAVDALKKLEGRIISFHVKDVSEFGVRKAHDVPWGTGAADAEAVLAEVHRQGFKGVFSIEYENNPENPLPDVAQSVAYFDKVAAGLAAKI